MPPYSPDHVESTAMIAGSAQNLYTLAMGSKPPRVTAKPTIRRLSEKGNVRKEFFEPAEFAAVVKALPEYLHEILLGSGAPSSRRRTPNSTGHPDTFLESSNNRRNASMTPASSPSDTAKGWCTRSQTA